MVITHDRIIKLNSLSFLLKKLRKNPNIKLNTIWLISICWSESCVGTDPRHFGAVVVLMAFANARVVDRKNNEKEHANEIKEHIFCAEMVCVPNSLCSFCSCFFSSRVKRKRQNQTNQNENDAAGIDRNRKVYITFLNRQFSSCATKFSQNICIVVFIAPNSATSPARNEKQKIWEIVQNSWYLWAETQLRSM